MRIDTVTIRRVSVLFPSFFLFFLFYSSLTIDVIKNLANNLIIIVAFEDIVSLWCNYSWEFQVCIIFQRFDVFR